MEAIVQIVSQAPVYVSAIAGILGALIVLFMLIPGEEPEGTLQKIVDFISKFSKK